MSKIFNTPDHTGEFTQEEINSKRGLGIISYIWLLFIVTLIAGKGSKYARFHGNQGLVLAIIETVSSALLGVLANIPYVGFIFSILNAVLSVVWVVFMIWAIINAAKGKARELPLIGSIRIIK